MLHQKAVDSASLRSTIICLAEVKVRHQALSGSSGWQRNFAQCLAQQPLVVYHSASAIRQGVFQIAERV
jgi:hypothetical protein